MKKEQADFLWEESCDDKNLPKAPNILFEEDFAGASWSLCNNWKSVVSYNVNLWSLTM